MKKRITNYILFILAVGIFSSCLPEGPGGKAVLNIYVFEDAGTDTVSVPYATVYVKYGATESPGTSVSEYDSELETDNAGLISTDNLRRGDYYLYAVGTSRLDSTTVSGGTHHEITNRDTERTVVIFAK